MGALRLAPFDETYLDAAALLLAARHRRLRQDEPALPERFCEPSAARAAVVAAWGESAASGVVATQDGRLRGFLFGSLDVGRYWGRSAWVRFAGHAIAADADTDLYRDLYAAASPHWLARGCFAHYAEVAADDRASLDAWFNLSFGAQQAYGLRPLPPIDPPGTPPVDPAISIRRADPADRATVAEMFGILWSHLGRSPVYSVRLPEDTVDWQPDADEALADPQVTIWLAEQDGRALGIVEMKPLTASADQPDIPENCCYLGIAATRADARGHGVATALTAHALRAAHAAGSVVALTDWRVTNLPASRLWPRLGFRPFQYRLHRLIDDRVAWASGAPL